MPIAISILSLAILLCAAYIVVMNWGCVIVSLRNKKRGIDRHHFTVPVISFILAAVAYVISSRADKAWMFIIPMLDIANWSLLWLPVGMIREWRKKRIETGAAPNGGSAKPRGGSGADEGPPPVN